MAEKPKSVPSDETNVPNTEGTFEAKRSNVSAGNHANPEHRSLNGNVAKPPDDNVIHPGN